MTRRLGALSALALLAGCAVGPNYTAPKPLDHAASFQDADKNVTRSDEPAARWWDGLHDEMLARLIDRALTANLDLAVALANAEAARATLDAVAATRIPALDSSASYSHGRGSLAALGGDSHQRSRNTDALSGTLNLSWELDLFGHVRRSIEAAEADAEQTEDLRRQMVTVVIAEVAAAYVDLRGAQLRLTVAEHNAETQRGTVHLTETQRDVGSGTDFDVARARTQLETTLASIPPLRATIVADQELIAVLTGQEPNALKAELEKAQPIPVIPAFVGVGDPESLLRRRPDVAASERALAGSTARIGVAIANLFPRVTLSADIGVEALHVGDISHVGAITYGAGPSISLPIFDLGLYARVRNADSTADAALATYQKTVLTALQETETALDRYAEERRRSEALKNAAVASKQAADLADIRYRFGAENFLTVLDAERQQLQAEDLLAQSNIQVAQDLVTLYRALGGGWETEAKTAAATP